MAEHENRPASDPIGRVADRDRQDEEGCRAGRIKQGYPFRAGLRPLHQQQVYERVADRNQAKGGGKREHPSSRDVSEHGERVEPRTIGDRWTVSRLRHQERERQHS